MKHFSYLRNQQGAHGFGGGGEVARGDEASRHMDRRIYYERPQIFVARNIGNFALGQDRICETRPDEGERIGERVDFCDAIRHDAGRFKRPI
ncbi:large extracellular protein (plasmid) [Bradyrhizobium diazoefficiens]|uniref:Large extracellular protein n=1 Tax=Bradyrhizobium diazoefficiens TaxID=1355477 RepID=A0A0E4FZM3_9BRAD|nr:large extracellular protein [Bradyrhizobium diazoefficiens]